MFACTKSMNFIVLRGTKYMSIFLSLLLGDLCQDFLLLLKQFVTQKNILISFLINFAFPGKKAGDDKGDNLN